MNKKPIVHKIPKENLIPPEVTEGAKEILKQYLAENGIQVVPSAEMQVPTVDPIAYPAVTFEEVNVYGNDWNKFQINPCVYHAFMDEAERFNEIGFEDLKANSDLVDTVGDIVHININTYIDCAVGNFRVAFANLYGILIAHINDIFTAYSDTGEAIRCPVEIVSNDSAIYYGDLGYIIQTILQQSREERIAMISNNVLTNTIVSSINNSGVYIYNDIRKQVAKIMSLITLKEKGGNMIYDKINEEMCTFMVHINHEAGILIMNLENILPFLPDINDFHACAPKAFGDKNNTPELGK